MTTTESTPVTEDPRRMPERLIAHQDTLEDYVETMAPPVAHEVPYPLAVVQDRDGGAESPELLAIDSKGQLVHFRHDPKSPSGWSQLTITVPGAPAGKAVGVKAFYLQGTLLAFVHYDGGATDDHPAFGAPYRVVAIERSAEGAWSPMKLDADMRNNLGRMSQLDAHLAADGTRYLFGITRGSAAMFFVGSRAADGTWKEAIKHRILEGDVAYHLMPGFGTDQKSPRAMTVTRVNGKRIYYRKGTMAGGRFSYQGEWRHWETEHELQPDQVVAFPAHAGEEGEVHFLLCQKNRLLHAIILDDGRVKAWFLSGRSDAPRGIESIAIGLDGDGGGSYSLLALDQDHRLRVLRQKDVPGLEFEARWLEQGDPLRALATPVMHSRGIELFGIDPEHRLVHTQQALRVLPAEEGDAAAQADGLWHTDVIEVPKREQKTEPDRVTSHQLELEAVDKHGLGIAKTPIQVTADRLAEVQVNGISYSVGPGRRQIFWTNDMGKVALRMPCARRDPKEHEVYHSGGLTAPVFTTSIVRESGPPIENRFASDLALYKRFADPAQMNPEKLKQSRFLRGQTVSEGTVKAIADMTNHAGLNMIDQFKSQDPEVAELCARPMATRRWKIDFRGGIGGIGGDGEPLLAAEIGEEDFLAFQKRIGGPDAASIWDLFGDFIRWVKNTAKAIYEAVIEIGQGAVKLIFETIRGAVCFTLKLADQVAEFLDGLYKTIGDVFDKAINAAGELLRMFEALFGFKDIVLTKDVLKSSVLGLLTTMKTSLDAHEAWATGKLRSVRDPVLGEIRKARQQLEGQELGKISARYGQRFDDRKHVDKAGPYAVQAGYVAQFVIDNGKKEGTVSLAAPSAEDLETLNSVIARLTTVCRENQLESAAEKAEKLLRDLAKDPANFLKATLKVLLDLLEGFVSVAFGVAEALLKLVFDLLRGIVVKLEELLTKRVDIPVITNLYETTLRAFGSTGELSLLDLSCLMAAVPATVLYKLYGAVTGRTTPFTEADKTRLPQILARFTDLRGVVEGPGLKLSKADERYLRELEVIFGITTACILFVKIPYDLATDTIAIIPGLMDFPLLPLAGIAMGLLMTALSWPMAISAKGTRTAADWYALGTWIYGVVVSTVESGITALMPTRMPKWFEVVGPILECIKGTIQALLGLVSLGFAIASGKASAILGAIGGVLGGLIGTQRLVIPFAAKGGVVGLVLAAWLWGVVGVGGFVGVGLHIASLATSDEAEVFGLQPA